MLEFNSRVSIDKGWSRDKKFCVTAYDGTKYLLRIYSPEQLDRKRNTFKMMGRAAELGVPMCAC